MDAKLINRSRSSFSLNNIWGIIWIASLAMLFEAQIRSIGKGSENISGIPLFSRFWLSDLGLLLPIMMVMLFSSSFPRFIKSRGFIFYVLIVFYGLLLGFIKGNSFSAITVDFRTSVGLITGLCLVEIIPKRIISLSRAVTCVLASSVLLFSFIVITSPVKVLFTALEGVTEPGAFVVSYLSLGLMAPGMILSYLTGKRSLTAISFISTVIALIISAGTMKTRSLVFAIIFALIVTALCLLGLHPLLKCKEGITPPRSRNVRWLVITFLLIGAFFWLQREQIWGFSLKIQKMWVMGFKGETAWVARTDEALDAFAGMHGMDHLFGKGFGSETRAASGGVADYTNSLHLSIFNPWWKLGIFAFLALLLMIIRLTNRFIRSIILIKNKTVDLTQKIKPLGVAVFAPGALTLAFIACLSGGWGIGSTVGLGILWGGYRTFTASSMKIISGK